MLRAVRRHAGARRARVVALAGVLAGAASGCGGVGQPDPYDASGIDGLTVPAPALDPDDFVDAVDNPWLALDAVGRWRYRVERDGRPAGSVEVETLGGRVEIAGVRATGVRSVSLTGRGGSEVSVVTRYYAQDEAGNVWLVGESSEDGSWRAGVDGAQAGLAMPAEPRVGDGWVRALVPGSPDQTVRVEDRPVELPSGVVGEAVWTTEGSTTASHRAYVAGRGLVHADDPDEGQTLELVEPTGD